MKKRSVILGLAGLVVAIGGAFSSLSANPLAQIVWVKVRNTPGGQIQCIQSNKQCDASGSMTCRVTVQTTSGPVTVNGYQSGCTTLLQTTTQPTGTFAPSPIPVEAIN